MRSRVFPYLRILMLMLTLMLGLAACGDHVSSTTSTVNTNCPTNVAQIGILDGVMKRFCGCAETAQTVVIPPATLTCTVSAGASVHFIFLGTNLQHQIRSTGTTRFVSSPVISGKSETVRTYAVPFPTPGTYSFVDTFYEDLAGRIIVN